MFNTLNIFITLNLITNFASLIVLSLFLFKHLQIIWESSRLYKLRFILILVHLFLFLLIITLFFSLTLQSSFKLLSSQFFFYNIPGLFNLIDWSPVILLFLLQSESLRISWIIQILRFLFYLTNLFPVLSVLFLPPRLVLHLLFSKRILFFLSLTWITLIRTQLKRTINLLTVPLLMPLIPWSSCSSLLMSIALNIFRRITAIHLKLLEFWRTFILQLRLSPSISCLFEVHLLTSPHISLRIKSNRRMLNSSISIESCIERNIWARRLIIFSLTRWLVLLGGEIGWSGTDGAVVAGRLTIFHIVRICYYSWDIIDSKIGINKYKQ